MAKHRAAEAWSVNDQIETMNDHLVGSRGDGMVTMMLMPVLPMTRDEALRLAAWLIVCADPEGSRFSEIYRAVMST